MMISPIVSLPKSRARIYALSLPACRAPKAVLTAALAMLLTVSSVHAADFTWSGSTSGGDWNTGSNWGGAFPDASDATATISTLASGAAVDISASVSLKQLSLTGANGSRITASTGGTMTLMGTNMDALKVSTADAVIDANVAWGIDYTKYWSNVSISTGRTLTINGVLSNLDNHYRELALSSGGKLVLNNAANSLANIKLIVSSGELSATSIGALSTADLKIGQGSGNATFSYTGAAGSYTKSVTIGTSGIAAFNSNGTGALTFSNSTFNAASSGATTVALGGSQSGVIKGVIQDNGAAAIKVTKQDSNTWTLGGANTYTGATTVNGGILKLDGSIAAGSAVTVNVGATLSGTGTANGSVIAAGGTVSAGLTLGSLTVQSAGKLGTTGTPAVTHVTGALQVQNGGTLSLTIAGLTGAGLAGGFDQVVVGGAGGVTLGDTSVLQLSLSGLVPFDTVTLIDNLGSTAISGTFGHVFVGGSEVTLGANQTFGYLGQTYALSYTGADGLGNDLTLTVVPEPQTWVMLLGGVGLLLGGQRLRRHS